MKFTRRLAVASIILLMASYPALADDADATADAQLKDKAAAALAGRTTPQLFDVLKSPSSKWYEHQALAAEFAKRDPADVLPGLLPICFAPDRELVAHTGPMSFKGAQELPWPVPMRYTANSTWRLITLGPATKHKGMLLLKMLKQKLPQQQADHVLDAITYQFVPQAEPVLLQIIDNKKTPYRSCLLAARTLLKNQGDKHYDDLVKLAAKSDYTKKNALFKVLSSNYVKRDKTDPRVTRMGFELLTELVARDPGAPRRAWPLIGDLQNYVGQKFYPDNEKEAYRQGDRGGLTDAYFKKGIDNAMRWWERESANLAQPNDAIGTNQLREAFISFVIKAEMPNADKDKKKHTRAKMRKELQGLKGHPLLAPYPFKGTHLDRKVLTDRIAKAKATWLSSQESLNSTATYTFETSNQKTLSDAELIMATRLLEQVTSHMESNNRNR